MQTDHRFISNTLFISVIGLFLAVAANPAFADDSTNDITMVTPSKTSPRTVGLDIVNQTVNPDKTTSLTFKWSEKGKDFERTVVVNDKTIVVYNGEIKNFSDLTADQMKAKAVATVGPDGVTTVLLRFGKKPLPKDKLTPEQADLLAHLAPPPTAASDDALNKRVVGIVDSLDLSDTNKQARVTAVVATDLKAVRDAHNAGLQLDPSVHQKFIAGLQADLTPDQVDSVKDKLTANKLPITLKAYHQILPNLKPEDEAKIIDWLKEAREQSLDVKNVDEMSPIFKKYKTEIEHYLDSHGYDWATSYKTFVDSQKSAANK
ncbi:MAG TPA: DUF3826 domain-containing protein [Verrucomicrobiae bacterium]|jgi:hypothetical protein